MLFLSYAEEDTDAASWVADRLTECGFEVFRWQDPQRRGKQFIRQMGGAIQQAEAFLVFLSPHFLASDLCCRERDIAIRREQQLQSGDPDRRFIHVLNTAPTTDSGFLGSYAWLDMARGKDWEVPMSELVGRLLPEDERSTEGRGGSEGGHGGGTRSNGGGSRGGDAQPHDPGSGEPKFRNRESELDQVLYGLVNPAGPHFWLVIAPPQLGKTWFLRRVASDRRLREPDQWVTQHVDLREQPPRVRANALAVLGLLSGIDPPATDEPQWLQHIAQEIVRTDKPHLWLLDGAELMDREAAITLRSCLGQIYHQVEEDGPSDVRLGLLVASRRDTEWRGVTPPPRVSHISLTEFNDNVVERALRDLNVEMRRRVRAAAYYELNGVRVHRLTEGLPALLVRCLDWIRREVWFGMERLESQELFDQLADPYIQNELLVQQSLFPGGQGQGNRSLEALALAFRVLAPYRLFTMSHLRYHFERDREFSRCLNDLQWNLEYLLKAIGGTALLAQPLSEPWQEIHPAIRRLLFKYYYKSPDDRAEAHIEARKFVEEWAGQQPGRREQVIGMVESLWHEASVLRLRDSQQMEQRLSESARALSRALGSSSSFTEDELRQYACGRIRNDEELEDVVSVVGGLFDRLIGIVETPL